MSKQKNQILILISVIVLGGLYAYIQYLFLPQLAELKDEYRHLTERQAYLATLEENFLILPSLKEQVIDLKAQVSTLNNIVPKNLDKPDIMLFIYNMAKNNGLSPKNLSYETRKDEGDFYTMGLNFTCSGPAENVYTLLDQLSKDNKYLLALDSISMNPGETEFSVSMRLVAYIYK